MPNLKRLLDRHEAARAELEAREGYEYDPRGLKCPFMGGAECMVGECAAAVFERECDQTPDGAWSAEYTFWWRCGMVPGHAGGLLAMEVRPTGRRLDHGGE